MTRLRAASLIIVFAALCARSATAQEIELTGPLIGACAGPASVYVPGRLEWAPWMAAGVAMSRAQTSLTAGVGVELTAGLLEYPGFPAIEPERYRRAPWRMAELRAGPWLFGATRRAGAIAEGGLTFHWGTVNDGWRRVSAAAGMFDLRVGGGYGAFTDGRSPHVAVALGWGYRTAFDRRVFAEGCDGPPPEALLDAALARLVTTLRLSTEFPSWELSIMLELSPTMALAPWRLSPRRVR